MATNFYKYLGLLCGLKHFPIPETVDARAGLKQNYALWPSDRESM